MFETYSEGKVESPEKALGVQHQELPEKSPARWSVIEIGKKSVISWVALKGASWYCVPHWHVVEAKLFVYLLMFDIESIISVI